MARFQRRSACLAGALTVAALLAVPTAQAHDSGHDFESIISGVMPVHLGAGIELRVVDYDEQIELVNESGETVIVMGYDGEPYARVESAGSVSLNLRSPALAPNNDRWGRTEPTGSEDAAAPPHWAKVGDSGRLTWFDRRSHYRRSGVPPQVADTAARQKLRDYRIPLKVGDEPAEIRGSLYWAGRRPFPVTAFVALLIGTAGVGLFGAWTLKRLRIASRSTVDPADPHP